MNDTELNKKLLRLIGPDSDEVMHELRPQSLQIFKRIMEGALVLDFPETMDPRDASCDRQAILTRLGEENPDYIKQKVIEELEVPSKDRRHSYVAIAVLSSLGTTESLELLGKMVQARTDQYVRTLGLAAIAKLLASGLRHESLFEILVKLMRSKTSLVRGAALEAMAVLKDKRALPFVIDLENDAMPGIRSEASRLRAELEG